MQCPYLSRMGEKKTCKRMLEEGLDGEVSDFDIEHYCVGNPLHCYYFRAESKPLKSLEKTTLKEKFEHLFTAVSQSVEVETHP